MTSFKCAIVLALLASLLAACDAPAEDNATRVVLVADGKRTELATTATTVREVLAQANVSLGEMDRVRPAETYAVSAGTVITVTRISQRFESEEQTVPYDQQFVRDATIAVGLQRLLQAGRNGQLEITYRLRFEDGAQVERIEVKRELVEPPQPEIILVGVAQAQSVVPFTGTLVYLANNNAYVMRQATSNRRALTSEGDLDGWVMALSPDGKTLLYTRAVSKTASGDEAPLNTLWTIDTVRTDAKPQQAKPSGILWAGWSPDGRNIAYSTGQPTSGPPGWRAGNDVWLAPFYAASGAIGAQQQVLDISSGGAYGWWGSTFAWSPKGDRIAIGSTEGVDCVEIETRKRSQLASFVAINTYNNWAWTPTVAWTPDGRFVLTVLPGLPPAGQAASDTPVFDVWALATDETFQAKLASEAGMWAAPRPSPTRDIAATQLIYGRAETPYTSSSSQYILYVMDRDGSNRTRLFPNVGVPGMEGSPSLKGLTDLAWSPNASQLVVVYQGNLYIVDVPGGKAQQLTVEGNVKLVQWAK
ncbi:MAG: G5 domain-containing protein [Thermoflexales bacterium]|nr:G5 domain-containing protein [Thermoflexales bacterium]